MHDYESPIRAFRSFRITKYTANASICALLVTSHVITSPIRALDTTRIPKYKAERKPLDYTVRQHVRNMCFLNCFEIQSSVSPSKWFRLDLDTPPHAITSPIRALDPFGFPIQREGIGLTHMCDNTFELLLFEFF
ncbi:uncharacterized protein G2W53_045011 [Senna tora]|uniref:Uncharacterized protein n=1 Tax=Senna tora TaxID=362788 RepID=A0A834SBL5_9FABA|nr:uncharacterized protein G2W53_045011 [Senna tora]